MRLLLVLLLLSFPALSRERTPQVPESMCSDPVTLSKYLTDGCYDPVEKARRIYRWIGENIDYDVEGFRSGQREVRADRVLARRLGVCSGYANLFKAMGEAAGLEVVVIPGEAKGVPGAGGDTGHAWNGVKVGERWLLIDSTWGAGYLGPDLQYHRAPSDFFFDTDPQRFITTHFPSDPKWQLLPAPLSHEQYLALVADKGGARQGDQVRSMASAGGASASNSPAPVVVDSPPLLQPRRLYSYDYRGARLIKPVAGTLPQGNQEFHVLTPGADSVLVVTSSMSYELAVVRGKWGEFRAMVPMEKGKVRVLARFGANARYEPLLEFDCR